MLYCVTCSNRLHTTDIHSQDGDDEQLDNRERVLRSDVLLSECVKRSKCLRAVVHIHTAVGQYCASFLVVQIE